MLTKIYRTLAALIIVTISTHAQTPQPSKSPTNKPTKSPTDVPTSSPTVIQGCPPKWQADSTIYPPGEEAYKKGDIVSNGRTNGIRDVYQCMEESVYFLYCPQAGYEPGGTLSHPDAWQVAWKRLGSCNTATTFVSPTVSPITDAPTYPIWDKGGCPKEFDTKLQTFYSKGDVVTSETNGLVYECISEVTGRCYQAGFIPGDEFEVEAWKVLGRCNGTITPTASPTDEVYEPWTLGGCPKKYVSQIDSGMPYAAGDVVENGGNVYECKEFPLSGYCAQPGYEPGVDTNYKDAWLPRGSCSGTLTPTPAPSIESWAGTGCPPSFKNATIRTNEYVEGDTVDYKSVVYECKTNNGRCNQAGYEPWTALGDAEAWDKLGSCTGTIAPTPTTNRCGALWSETGCPEVFTKGPNDGPNEDYVETSLVSQDGCVYQCKEYPLNGYCKLYDPDSGPDENGDGQGDWGALGWELKGSCTGTLSPTPAQVLPLWSLGGCPEDTYELYGDYEKDAYVQSPAGTVWQCISSFAGQCGQPGYEPGVDYAGHGALYLQAWSLKGSCTGILPPSDYYAGEALPIWEKVGCPNVWDEDVTYQPADYVAAGIIVFRCKDAPDNGFCNMIPPEGTAGHSGTLGWTAIGSCSGTIAPTSAPNCGDVPLYESGKTWEDDEQQVYVADGTVYQCKGGVYKFWCDNAAYAPDGQYGNQAWNVVGSC